MVEEQIAVDEVSAATSWAAALNQQLPVSLDHCQFVRLP